MQTLSNKHPNNISQQTRKIAVITILLFALSGLISGFAMGAFVPSKLGVAGSTSTRSGTTPVTQNTQPPISSAHGTVSLGAPQIQDYSYTQVANGSTSYTFSVLIVDKSNKPIQASDVTCKIWLTENEDVTSILQANRYAIPRANDTLGQPFPSEVSGGFNYISPTQQTQPCTPGSNTIWNYTLSPSVGPGTYYIAVLADWKGKNWYWSWQIIKIKKD
jgi:hypothetical protein